MTPDRKALVERLRRSRARIVEAAPSEAMRAEPVPAAGPPPGPIGPETVGPETAGDAAAGPVGDGKAARLARARELIRRTERGWKEVRSGPPPSAARQAAPAPATSAPVASAPIMSTQAAHRGPPIRLAEPFTREDHDVPLDDRYGGDTLGGLAEAEEARTERLTERLQARPGAPPVDFSRALFLDTETSGLAGGTGTFAFLIGVGRVVGDRFRVTQLLLRDPVGEPAMLAELAAIAGNRPDVVTYNGATFDLPLLASRFGLYRLPNPFETARHLDLLPPARRLFKPRCENARLTTLEREVLGVERDDDIPGDRIPQIFFDFLRAGHHPAMGSVLAHNRYDILTLAALALRARERMAEGWWSDDPLDLHGVGHHFWRRGEHEAAIPLLEQALAAGLNGVNRDRCLLDLGERRKQLDDWNGALELWNQVSLTDRRERLEALVWFAKHEEHHRKDPARALAHVEDALERLPRVEMYEDSRRRFRHDLEHRANRLRGQTDEKI